VPLHVDESVAPENKKPLAVGETGGAVTARIGRLPVKGSLMRLHYTAPQAPSRDRTPDGSLVTPG